MTDGGEPEQESGVNLPIEADETPVGAPRVVPRRWRQTAIAAEQAYRLAIRNRWAPALLVLFAAFGLLVVAFGGSAAGPRRTDAIVISLAELSTYLVPLAALAFGYDAIVGADDAGWLDVTFALPVDRSTVVAGTYLGRASILGGSTLLGFGLAGIVLVALASIEFGLFARFLLGSLGLGLSFLAVGVLVSTVAAEKTHALGGVLLVWVWFVFLHDLLAIAVVASLDLPSGLLGAFVLANPADCFRVFVLSGVHATGGVAAAITTVGLSSWLVALGLLGWATLPVALAGVLVKRRTI